MSGRLLQVGHLTMKGNHMKKLFAKIRLRYEMAKFVQKERKKKEFAAKTLEHEPEGEERQKIINHYNKFINAQNKENEEIEKHVHSSMKSRAKAFDMALYEAVKSSFKYLHYRNLATGYDLEPVFETSNKKRKKGFKTINLKYVRINMKKAGVDYQHMTAKEIYNFLG